MRYTLANELVWNGSPYGCKLVVIQIASSALLLLLLLTPILPLLGDEGISVSTI